MHQGKSARRLPAVVRIPFLAIAAFVAAATVAQAIRQDSWGPIWSIGWLPAVIVAATWTTAGTERCRPRPRRKAPGSG